MSNNHPTDDVNNAPVMSSELINNIYNKKPPFTVALFDLDGTLTNSAPGIMKRIKDALIAYNFPEPDEETLFSLIGPPLKQSFIYTFGMSEELADEVLVYQRKLAYERGPGAGSKVYPGINEMLKELKNNNFPCAIATSKGEVQAFSIAEYYEFKEYFKVITGASADEIRSAKEDIVIETLNRLSKKGIDISNPVMVGDRIFDIYGAAKHNIPTIAVDWGYGNKEEHVGAYKIVSTTNELLKEILTK